MAAPKPMVSSARRAIASTPEATISPEASMDLVCVGNGLPSLAIAVALADRGIEERVCFLERQPEFLWSRDKTLTEKRLRTSFLRDLITTKNPRSRFTFINYLKTTGQLALFANASSLYPSRLAMNHYLAWAAHEIDRMGWVNYGKDVVCIEPQFSSFDRVESFAVHLKDVLTGEMSIVTSKLVIVSSGLHQHVPVPLKNPLSSGHVIHEHSLNQLFTVMQDRVLDVAIIGSGQRAAEVFEEIQSIPGGHNATLFIEDSALRPTDVTAFSQDLVDVPGPSLAPYPPQLRQKLAHGGQNGKRFTASVELLERLYANQYTQGIHQKDLTHSRFSIDPHAEVIGVEIVENVSRPRVRLVLKNPESGVRRMSDRSFDVIIAATGYTRNETSLLSAEILSLLDRHSIDTDRDYKIDFKKNALRDGCAIWDTRIFYDDMVDEDSFLHLAELGDTVARSVVDMLSVDEQKRDDMDVLSML